MTAYEELKSKIVSAKENGIYLMRVLLSEEFGKRFFREINLSLAPWEFIEFMGVRVAIVPQKEPIVLEYWAGEKLERMVKVTNYEKIKAMSVQELAELLCGCSDCYDGKCYGARFCGGTFGKASGLVEWLLEEAEE